jgi:uroporphyrinogen-III synthase
MDGPAVLVTRPEASAAQTARRLAALGWRPVAAPMLHVVPVDADLPPPADVQAVLITSAVAIGFLPACFHATKLLAVGDATAGRAQAAGFATVASAGADAAALAALAERSCDPAGAPLLLASAEGQGAALAEALRRAGFRILHRAVYAARPVLDLPEPVRHDLLQGAIDAAVFFSPATSRAFVAAFLRACPPRIVFNVVALAISSEAAAPLALLPWRRIRVAKRPNQDELLALLP